MKQIQLRGCHKEPLFANVDDEDFDRINQHRWYRLVVRGSLTIYARTIIGDRTVYMHRMVMEPVPDDMTVEHDDRNGLNCVKSNLIIMTQGDNMRAWIPPPDPNYLQVHTVRHQLADGTIREYRYNRKTGERLDSGAKRRLRRT